ncbi:hypothetical protein [Streptomyces sp. VRA16 Mangrove soil]|uniref:hypothetical protein n=1 Tax=Streptomyces sp. VRA16 Mangrove soil TaxID=2817434 RepID=UPI001A9DFC5D|nr:hypothetical protein [Streptomyces sp. VRA16 Mangrove soil]MBO1334176.1 hypothetical protein [Streptomyces sp. VRA16 Mangrove soil]
MHARMVGAVCAALLLALALTGCQALSGSSGGSSRAASASPSHTPSGYGAVFLAVDECSSRGRTSFTEVPCRSESAVARVVARYEGSSTDGPACPARTDFVLHISENRPATDENGDGTVSQGYACMRNLEPPHPGDPGGGGGPRTIVGDCVYAAGKGQVRETACDGSGERAPQYRVRKAVKARSGCPSATALYVSLGGPAPVGCAVKL